MKEIFHSEKQYTKRFVCSFWEDMKRDFGKRVERDRMCNRVGRHYREFHNFRSNPTISVIVQNVFTHCTFWRGPTTFCRLSIQFARVLFKKKKRKKNPSTPIISYILESNIKSPSIKSIFHSINYLNSLNLQNLV